MSSNLRDVREPNSDSRSGGASGAVEGLNADELRAEQSSDLPDREAMSILDVGGVGVGLPPPGYLDGAVESAPPVGTLPVDVMPTPQPLPPDQLPIEGLPVHTLPVEPVEGLPSGPIGIPELPDVPDDVSVDV